jgi:hypothetical protein
MAKSYYGYVKRDVENQIDWASITKEMVTTLEEEQGRREKKKADIDKASREFGKVLTDAEGSSHKGLNEFWLDSSSSIQELRRMQDDLLKRGLLDYKSYVAQRQNLTDGSDELINLVKGFDSKWTAVKDDPNASSFDYWNIGNIQGFGNFSDYKTWANPTDGKLSLGKIVLNPKTGQKELSNNPTEYQQVSFLKNRMNQRAPKYDYDAAIKKVTENVGRYVKAKSVGAAKTIEDVTKSDAYQKQINTWIDAIIENPFNAASILTDTLGYAENYTDDDKQANEFDLVDTGKTDKDDNPIMMKSYKYVETEIDPVQKGSGLRRPKLKEEQKDQLREAIRNEIESRLDYIETAAPRDTPSVGERVDRKQAKRVGEAMSKTFYSNDVKDFEVGINLIKGQTGNPQNIVDYNFRNNPETGQPELILIKLDKNGRRSQLPPIAKSENAKDYFTSIVTEFAPKGADIDEIVNAALGALPKDAVRSSTEFQYSIQDAPKPIDKFQEYIETKLPTISRTSSKQAKKDLELIFGNLGLDFKVETAFGSGADVTIKIEDGVEKTFNLDSDEDIDNIEAFLIKNYTYYKKIIEQSENIIDEELRGIDRPNPQPQSQPGAGDAIVKQTN